LAKITEGTPKALHETADVKWFSKDEIPWDKIAFSGITQALKIVFEIDKPYFPK